MTSDPRTFVLSKPALAAAVAAIVATAVIWIWSPVDGEANLIVTATMLALVIELLTGGGVLAGMAGGAAFIVIAVLFFITPDPSGLGPPEFVIPIQLAFAAPAMFVASKLGRWLRNRSALEL